MEEKFNFTQLLQKPIAMMTGEELCFLIGKSVESIENPHRRQPPKATIMALRALPVCSVAVYPQPTVLKKVVL